MNKDAAMFFVGLISFLIERDIVLKSGSGLLIKIFQLDVQSKSVEMIGLRKISCHLFNQWREKTLESRNSYKFAFSSAFSGAGWGEGRGEIQDDWLIPRPAGKNIPPSCQPIKSNLINGTGT